MTNDSIEHLDLDVLEQQRGAFGLPADGSLGHVTLARTDQDPVDLAGQLAVLADDLGRVPLANLDGLLLRVLLHLERALGAADGEYLAVVLLLALDLDALGPDLVVALDVDEQPAVAVLDELPVEAQDVVLVALVGV